LGSSVRPLPGNGRSDCAQIGSAFAGGRLPPPPQSGVMLTLFVESGGSFSWLLAWALAGMTAVEFRAG